MSRLRVTVSLISVADWMHVSLPSGKIESLKHLKKEINEARKGSECGISLEGYRELKEGDQIVSVQKTERLQDL